jgi:hypothetical protein
MQGERDLRDAADAISVELDRKAQKTLPVALVTRRHYDSQRKRY